MVQPGNDTAGTNYQGNAKRQSYNYTNIPCSLRRTEKEKHISHDYYLARLYQPVRSCLGSPRCGWGGRTEREQTRASGAPGRARHGAAGPLHSAGCTRPTLPLSQHSYAICTV